MRTTYQEHHQMDKECVEKGDSPRHLVWQNKATLKGNIYTYTKLTE